MSDATDELDELSKMRERFQLAEESFQKNREEAEAALRFYFGEQWDAQVLNARRADGRPCFTLNKLPAIVKQVLNEARANVPAIQINPVADGADEDTAEVIQGLTRHVETQSDAEIAYETAFTYLVLGGFGSWRVTPDYLPMSFDQDLFIQPIANPFSVYWDPHATKPDKSDARFCFITGTFRRDDYADRWKDSELAGLGDFSAIGDRAPGWASKDSIRVVEYFEVETEESELVKLTDGRVIWWDDMDEKLDRIAVGPDGKPIARKAERRRVYVSKTNGLEWLREAGQTEKRVLLPIDEIPVVTVFGDEVVIDGEQRVRGMVHNLEEAQRLFNYNSSAIAETMSLGAKAQWIAPIKSIEDFDEVWRHANVRNVAVLPYKPTDGKPEKITSEPPIQAMSAARMQSSDDLRSISGVFDATQQPEQAEVSGKAILARRRQTSTGNANYTANWARGIKRTARLLLKYFPVIYDTARVIRIIGADQQQKQVMVHAGQPDSLPPALPPGVKEVFDISVGTYEVNVAVGPSYETRRQEAVDMLLTLIAGNPQLAPIIGDLVVNEMDFAGKSAVVQRLQMALPPQLRDQSQNQDPAVLASHNMQLMQQNQGLLQQVQHLTQVLQTEQIKTQSRERVEAIKSQTAQAVAASRLEIESKKAQAQILTHAADQHTQIVHDHALADRAEQHAHGLAAQEAFHEFLHADAAHQRAKDLQQSGGGPGGNQQ